MASGSDGRLVKDANSIIGALIAKNRADRARGEKIRSRNRDTIPGGVGRGTVASGGIASPLTETNAGDRAYHNTPRFIQSTDGLLTFQVRDIKEISFSDANGSSAVFVLDQPDPVEVP